MALNKDDIIGASDIPVKLINVPEWGGDVYVKRQSIRERDFLIPISNGFVSVEPPKGEEKPKMVMKKGKDADEAYSKYRIYTVGFALCDENGIRIFSDEEIDTVLGKKSIEAIERIYRELGNGFKEA